MNIKNCWATPMPESSQENIKEAITSKFTHVANGTGGNFSYRTGEKGAINNGYDPLIIAATPEDNKNSFCGVGNPLKLIDFNGLENVTFLDIGCGSAVDMLTVAKVMGDKSEIVGVDITEAMVNSANRMFAKLNIKAKAFLTEGDDLPFANDYFDVISSNGVFNLCLNKLALYKEIHRTLKPDGRFVFADVIRTGKIISHNISTKSWSNWIGGAVSVGDQVELLREAGFEDVCFHNLTGIRTSKQTFGAHFSATKPDK